MPRSKFNWKSAAKLALALVILAFVGRQFYRDLSHPDIATLHFRWPWAVLAGLLSMARALGTEIVAEGVENEEQAVYLRSHGVMLAQGYLFAPPLKGAAFRELALARNKPPAPAALPKAAA